MRFIVAFACLVALSGVVGVLIASEVAAQAGRLFASVAKRISEATR